MVLVRCWIILFARRTTLFDICFIAAAEQIVGPEQLAEDSLRLFLSYCFSFYFNYPPQSVDPSGVADASLYARLARAGLVDLVAFPTLVTLDDPDGPIWRYREDHVLAQLTPAETEVWHAARAAALRDGTLLHASALHCEVGRKPG